MGCSKSKLLHNNPISTSTSTQLVKSQIHKKGKTTAPKNAPVFNNDFTYLFKVVMIGDSGSGKSSVLLRFADNTFLDNIMSTIGVDFKIRTLKIGEDNVKLQIWDTAGQERFKTITSSYYRGTHGVVLVFDVTNEETYQNIQKWLADVERSTDDSVFKILVGNKADLLERQVPKQVAEDFAKSVQVPYIETSAKEATNIQFTFEELSRGMIKNMPLLDK